LFDLNEFEFVSGELLAENCEFLKDRFDEICGYVLSLRDHRHFLIRRTVITLIPQLAKFNVQRFSEQHLALVTDYLLNSVHSNKARGPSYLALGEMAMVRISFYDSSLISF
jgi:FKBP12-rapamycin complex-associated protein